MRVLHDSASTRQNLVNAQNWWTAALATLLAAALSEVKIACLVGSLVVMASRLAGLFFSGRRTGQSRLLVGYAHRLWIGGLVGTAAGQMAAGMTLRKLDVLNCACGVKSSSQAACSSLRRKIGRWLARLLVTPLVASHPDRIL